MSKTIREWQEQVHKTAKEHGWWDDVDIEDPNVVSSKICLMHSELSEALEEVRSGNEDLYYKPDNPNKPEGMVVELADAVIRIMDLCGAMDLDLEEAMQIKAVYNDTRSYKHGGKKI